MIKKHLLENDRDKIPKKNVLFFYTVPFFLHIVHWTQTLTLLQIEFGQKNYKRVFDHSASHHPRRKAKSKFSPIM